MCRVLLQIVGEHILLPFPFTYPYPALSQHFVRVFHECPFCSGSPSRTLGTFLVGGVWPFPPLRVGACGGNLEVGLGAGTVCPEDRCPKSQPWGVQTCGWLLTRLPESLAAVWGCKDEAHGNASAGATGIPAMRAKPRSTFFSKPPK